jgi:hypothetical protein
MKTSLSSAEVKQRATQNFTPMGYSIKTTSETQIVFSDGRDVNWVLFVILLLCILIGAIIYYFLACKEHQIILNIIPLEKGCEVNLNSTTPKSSTDANNFMNTLPQLVQ